ncbi:MAG: hypothetical protein ACQESR_18340 [Planctomycetota bacterium]
MRLAQSRRVFAAQFQNPLSWQIEQIRDGHHMLPWTPYSRNMNAAAAESIEAQIRQLAEWGLPFVLLTGGQWEADFYSSEKFQRTIELANRPGRGVGWNRANDTP